MKMDRKPKEELLVSWFFLISKGVTNDYKERETTGFQAEIQKVSINIVSPDNTLFYLSLFIDMGSICIY